MIRALALPLALCALAAQSPLLAAQASAEDGADLVVARTSGVFERIDPDNEMPRAADAAPVDEAALTYAGLPPLSDPIDLPTVAVPVPEEPVMIVDPAPRGPAVRMIAKDLGLDPAEFDL